MLDASFYEKEDAVLGYTKAVFRINLAIESFASDYFKIVDLARRHRQISTEEIRVLMQPANNVRAVYYRTEVRNVRV